MPYTLNPTNPKWGFPKIRDTLFGGLHNKDYSILGSILGSPYLGKLPNHPILNPKPQTQTLKPQPQTLKPKPYLYEFSGGPVGLPGLPGALAAFCRCASALSRCDLCFGALGASAGLGCFGYGVSGFKNFGLRVFFPVDQSAY